MKRTCDTYQQFEDEVVNRIREQRGSMYEVEATDVQKNNGVLKRAILISKPEEEISPLIYLEPYFECYKNGTALDAIVKMIDMAYENNQGRLEMKNEQLFDFQFVKGRIVYQLINWKKNERALREMPHKRLYGDLVAIFVILLNPDGSGQVVAKVTNSHMKLWGTNLEELWELAERNTPQLQPVKLTGLMEALREIQEEKAEKIEYESDPKDEDREEETIYILSNESGQYGAAAILYPGVLKQAAEQLGDDLLILPSSIHETLLMRRNEVPDLRYTAAIVQAVNREKVAPEEILANSMYLYNQSSDCIKRVSA